MAVLYPGVAVPTELPEAAPETGEIVIFSVNRFDPRKNLPLAVDALEKLRGRVSSELFSSDALNSPATVMPVKFQNASRSSKTCAAA